MDELYILEHIEEIIPITVNQKQICGENYGFPREIIKDPTVSSTEKNKYITKLLECMITPLPQSSICLQNWYSSKSTCDSHIFQENYYYDED